MCERKRTQDEMLVYARLGSASRQRRLHQRQRYAALVMTICATLVLVAVTLVRQWGCCV